MGKKNFWTCEHCSKRAFEPFPKTWWHFKHLLVGAGVYMDVKDFVKYKSYGNLTFCSLTCLVSFLNMKFKKSLNPSSR